jgi:hypothetical protein
MRGRMQQATFLAGFLACRSQMFFNWKRGEHLRTERTKNRRAINARVGSQLLSLPHDFFAKCGACRREKRFKISRLRAVLNPRSREVWRHTAEERQFGVSETESQCGGLCAKARVYWGFLRARKPAEKVWRGSTGGGRGIRTRDQVVSGPRLERGGPRCAGTISYPEERGGPRCPGAAILRGRP